MPYPKRSRHAVPALLLLALAVLAAAGAAGLYLVPVRGYTVTCIRRVALDCALEQRRADVVHLTHVTLDERTRAAVRILVVRRSAWPRVLLELRAPDRTVFVAEFEGGDAAESAGTAADRLNQLFRSRAPGRVRVAATPPAYLRDMSWALLAVMLLLVVAAARELRRRPAGGQP